MPTLTITLPDETAKDLAELAEARQLPSAEALLTELAREAAATAASLRDVPPEVMEEVRRRQQDGPEVGRPASEFFDELEAKLMKQVARDQHNEARA